MAEYEVLLLKFPGGVIVTMEEAQDGHVFQGLGGGVEVVHDWKLSSSVANRAQVLYKVVFKPPLGLTDVEEPTKKAADALDHISTCGGAYLLNVEGFLGTWDGGEEGGVGA
eukprot:g42789.t1